MDISATKAASWGINDDSWSWSSVSTVSEEDVSESKLLGTGCVMPATSLSLAMWPEKETSRISPLSQSPWAESSKNHSQSTSIYSLQYKLFSETQMPLSKAEASSVGFLVCLLNLESSIAEKSQRSITIQHPCPSQNLRLLACRPCFAAQLGKAHVAKRPAAKGYANACEFVGCKWVHHIFLYLSPSPSHHQFAN